MERPDSRSLPTLEVCAIATPPKATDAGTLSEIQTGLTGLNMPACDRAGSSQTALHIGAGSSELHLQDRMALTSATNRGLLHSDYTSLLH